MAKASDGAKGPTRHQLRAVRIAESIATELRYRILRGDLPQGSLLPKQDDLVTEFGVSYPSIREALRILETEGLITVRRGKVGGAKVRRPGPAAAGYALGLSLSSEQVRIGDLAEALLDLEPRCVSRCAVQASEGQDVTKALIANIERSQASIADDTAFTHSCREFHESLVEIVDNQTLRVIVRGLESLWSAQEETWAEMLSRSGEYFTLTDREKVLRAHWAITHDIAAGNAAGAERHARMHLAATQRAFLERFNDQVIDVTSTGARRALRSSGSNGWLHV